MIRFRALLVPGGKVPYDTWTFVVLPARVHAALGGAARTAVRGTLQGVPFRATAARGEGVVRFPVPAAVRQVAGVGVGTSVEVVVERDPEAAAPELPLELSDALARDAKLAAQFQAMAPSHRRAWAQYVAEAKRPETRARRVERAREGIAQRRFPSEKPRSDRS